MSQSEREDYDDRPPKREPPTLPVLLKHAGTAWLVAWYWFLAGVVIFFGFQIVIRWPKSGDFIAYFIVHLLGVWLFLFGSHAVRKGFWKPLVFITILSFLVGGYCWVIFLGGSLAYNGFLNDPTKESKILGVAAMTFSTGFVVLGLVACCFTLRFAFWSYRIGLD